MFQIPKPTLETYLSHYTPEEYSVTPTPMYNIVPLRKCPLNSQSSDMQIRFSLYSGMHGQRREDENEKRMRLHILRNQNPVHLIHTFKKMPFST